nr:hypothetical protein [Mesorhizobium mediterraneum]
MSWRNRGRPRLRAKPAGRGGDGRVAEKQPARDHGAVPGSHGVGQRRCQAVRTAGRRAK